MKTAVIKGFSDSEILQISAPDICNAFLIFGEKMRFDNEKFIERLWNAAGKKKKNKLLDYARVKLDRLYNLANNRVFEIEEENKLLNYLSVLENYCKGSKISIEMGALIQMEVNVGCQTLIIQNRHTNEIHLVHSEEDMGSAFDDEEYNFKWVEMQIENKKYSFFAYPGLVGWGSTFSINHAMNSIQIVDDLNVRKKYENGTLWSNLIAHIIFELGSVDKAKTFINKLDEFYNKSFHGGFAIHLIESVGKPNILSLEFAGNSIKYVKPEVLNDRLIVAQTNCPREESFKAYSNSGYPTKGETWSISNSELYVEMRDSQTRIENVGKKTNWFDTKEKDKINFGLEILANPWGNIWREKTPDSKTFKYYQFGFPNKYMVAHFVSIVTEDELSYYVGKQRPEPIDGMMYEVEVTPDYKYGLNKTWEEAKKERIKFKKQMDNTKKNYR